MKLVVDLGKSTIRVVSVFVVVFLAPVFLMAFAWGFAEGAGLIDNGEPPALFFATGGWLLISVVLTRLILQYLPFLKPTRY